MKTEVFYRKGENNARFVAMVREVNLSLTKVKAYDRLKPELLKQLYASDSRLSFAWQDGDSMRNLLGDTAHRFDIYDVRNKVAIEIEESEIKYLWKDIVKFIVGYRKKNVEYAILICPFKYSGKAMKRCTPPFSTAKNISQFMANMLWIKNLAIIGYEK